MSSDRVKIDLYIDFDGVILNTINVTYQMMKDEKIKNQNEFYYQLDWKKLILKCMPICDSLSNIHKLINSNLYKVRVLTHICTKEEGEAKKEFLRQHFDDLEVILVDRNKNKCDAVPCKGAILVDDYKGNLDLWSQKGGIAVKFSDNGKKSSYFTITNLEELLHMYDIFYQKKNS